MQSKEIIENFCNEVKLSFLNYYKYRQINARSKKITRSLTLKAKFAVIAT